MSIRRYSFFTENVKITKVNKFAKPRKNGLFLFRLGFTIRLNNNHYQQYLNFCLVSVLMQNMRRIMSYIDLNSSDTQYRVKNDAEDKFARPLVLNILMYRTGTYLSI